MCGLALADLAERVADAHRLIAPHVRRTCLEYSAAYSEISGANVYFKCENLQQTGSFKLRGAMSKCLSLDSEQIRNGVVAASTGNHGKAVAHAAAKTRGRATVFVPQGSDPTKVAAVKQLGAQVEIAGSDCIDAERAAREFAVRKDAVYISPYNDPAVIAGQGTIGLELCDQLDRIDAVVASMGGAGLITGIAGYVKPRFPDCRIVGCSPENSRVMIDSLRAGEILDSPSTETLSDGTAGGVEQGSITFELCRQLVDECVTVTEPEIGSNLLRVIESHGMLIEGAAAVAVAGLLRIGESLRGKNVVVVLCGANIGVETLSRVIRSTDPATFR